MKRILKDYFSFSRKERIAVIILLLLTGAFMAAPYLYVPKRHPPVISKALAEYLAKQPGTTMPADSVVVAERSGPAEIPGVRPATYVLFAFDPNTASENDWIRLGVYPRTARTILNYRNKGGRFRQAEDIRKIWGLKKEMADRLLPYVRIPQQEPKAPGSHAIETSNRKPATLLPASQVRILDINTAMVEDWRSLPGIGEILSSRIVKFRERLGGFTEMAQLRKTYGFSDSLFGLIAPYLALDPANIPKIDVNTASAYELRIKTGIPDGMAKAIVYYRERNGPYISVMALKKSILISDSIFEKLILRIKTD